MRVSYSFVSTVVLLAGQSQSAPILGLGDGLLNTNDPLLGGLTHTVNALPVTSRLTDGLVRSSQTGTTLGLSTDGLLGGSKASGATGASTSTGLITGTNTATTGGLRLATDHLTGESKAVGELGASKSSGLLGGPKSGELLTLSGNSPLNTRLWGEPTLKKRISLPLVGELSLDGFKTKAKAMTSSLTSKLGGLLRKRDKAMTLPSISTGLSSIPVVGYMPGLPTLPAVGSLPVISSIPGVRIIPGFGTTTAPSGLGAVATATGTVDQHGVTTSASFVAKADPSDAINAGFAGIFGGLSKAPVAINHFL